jgi:hypothetical protein
MTGGEEGIIGLSGAVPGRDGDRADRSQKGRGLICPVWRIGLPQQGHFTTGGAGGSTGGG